MKGGSRGTAPEANRLRLLGVAGSLVFLAGTPLRAQPADLVLTGGAIYTLDAARSWAEALAVKSGKIAFVGTDRGAAPWIGPQTRVLRLEGRMVLPGFQDAHIHPISGGMSLAQCSLDGLASEAAILDKVRSCAGEKPKRPWLLGAGWPLTAFRGGIPTKDRLDSIEPSRPVYLASSDGHTAWVNSKALELAGITGATPNPLHGRIERDPKSGAAVGTLQEDAMLLVSRLIPVPTREERSRGLERALSLLNQHGVTALQAMLIRSEPPYGREALETFREAEGRGVLTAKTAVALDTDPEGGEEQVDALVGLRQEFASPRVRPVAAKIFEDGIIEAHTAALLEPYLDTPGERGEPIWAAERWNPVVIRLDREGFNVHIHAIGDRAVRLALDSFEAARKSNGASGLRHQIAHVQVVHPDDVPRFSGLGVIANFQPLWAYADSYVKVLTRPALGPERSRWLYPMGSVVRAGGMIAFGSDWDVSSLNPLEGIQVAVTRENPSGDADEPLLPEQALDLPTALAAYTIGSAYANSLEAETGSLEVGKAADLAVLSVNLFRVPAREIGRAKVVLTLLDGQPVFRDPSFAW